MTDNTKMREAMIDQDGAVWEKIGGAWSLYKPVQSVAVVGEAVAEAYVYEDVDGDDILGLRLLKEDYPMQHGEKLYIEPPTSITQAETHALELRAYEATVQNLEQRIRELESQRVPEGWKLVPIEATQEMLKESGLYDDDTIEVNSAASMAGQIYRAMLAAAPKKEPRHD